jgi:hypothetical protein
MSTLALWISLGALTLGAVYSVIYFFRYRGSDEWPTVQGTVEALIRIRSTNGRASDPVYGILSYSYQIDGEYYSGEWDTPMFPSKSEVDEFIGKYIPLKSAVVVHHDPRHPERSTLEIDPRLGQPDYLTELNL